MNDHWMDRLSEYIDGELTGAERQRLESHLATCSACERTLEKLQAVKARAATLQDVEPDADLWPTIASRIAAEADTRVIAMRPRTRWQDWRVTLSLPQLAAAAIVMMAVSIGSMWFIQSRRTPQPADTVASAPSSVQLVDFSDQTYDQAIADLERALYEGRDRFDLQTVRVLEQNLMVIDRAIAQSRQALEADPGNAYLSTHLAAAKQRKIALLRWVTAVADSIG